MCSIFDSEGETPCGRVGHSLTSLGEGYEGEVCIVLIGGAGVDHDEYGTHNPYCTVPPPRIREDELCRRASPDEENGHVLQQGSTLSSRSYASGGVEKYESSGNEKIDVLCNDSETSHRRATEEGGGLTEVNKCLHNLSQDDEPQGSLGAEACKVVYGTVYVCKQHSLPGRETFIWSKVQTVRRRDESAVSLGASNEVGGISCARKKRNRRSMEERESEKYYESDISLMERSSVLSIVCPKEANVFRRWYHKCVLLSSALCEVLMFGGKLNQRDLCGNEVYSARLSGLMHRNRSSQLSVDWSVVSCAGIGPGSRYGHSMVYMDPYVIVFGGHDGKDRLNDLWLLSITGGDQTRWGLVRHGCWQRVELCMLPGAGVVWPTRRVFHAAAVVDRQKEKSMVDLSWI
eukprot:GHVQ01023321.1.p1 GENE.GHVQ01023321.1~~GHVQ01023321.1.p1  ORF type:complete len:403 (+),score=47.26 GHVQ01023321.1:375-1583(+)